VPKKIFPPLAPMSRPPIFSPDPVLWGPKQFFFAVGGKEKFQKGPPTGGPPPPDGGNPGWVNRKFNTSVAK